MLHLEAAKTPQAQLYIRGDKKVAYEHVVYAIFVGDPPKEFALSRNRPIAIFFLIYQFSCLH